MSTKSGKFRPEVVQEMGQAYTMNSWLYKANIAPKYHHDAIFYQNDPVAADLGRAAITYILGASNDVAPANVKSQVIHALRIM
ncbi:MAG: hypothetical protein AAF709_06755 [Pseudomonadota bacterium]